MAYFVTTRIGDARRKQEEDLFVPDDVIFDNNSHVLVTPRPIATRRGYRVSGWHAQAHRTLAERTYRVYR
jgi:hypothetical protein